MASRRVINLQTLQHVRREMSRVYSECRRGQTAPEVGSKLVFMLTQIGRVIYDADVERRIAALEESQKR